MPRLSRAEKREETRRALLNSAARCFARSGFEAAAIDVIAEDAGYSRGAFYSNFQSKDEVFLLLLKAHLKAELGSLEDMLAKVQSSDDLISRVAHRYRNLGRDEDWCLLFSEFQLYVMRDGSKASAFKALFDEYRLRLSAMIGECCERIGLTLEITPYELAVSLLSIAHGLSLQRVSNPAIRHTLAAEAIAIFAAGAFANAPRSKTPLSPN